MIQDPETGFSIANPYRKVLPSVLPDEEDIQSALKPLILSASGWRKVFADDGEEESTRGDLLPADRILVAAMGRVFSDFLKDRSGKERPTLLLGMDSRFTGPLMGDILTRVFLSRGVKVRPLFIVAAPEIMAATGKDKGIDGFCYISASHNPLGHNGVKFGLDRGGVIGGADARDLILDYKELVQNREELARLCDIEDSAEVLTDLYASCPSFKKESYRVYLDFAREVGAGGSDKVPEVFDALKRGIRKSPLGVVAELNGSARSLSVDREYLEALGVQVRSVHAVPRDFAHAIVPEGASLDLCREELEKAQGTDPAFALGYVPDCDGDRGNLVYYSEKEGRARILQAQEVFALSVLAELTDSIRLGQKEPSALAVNGPTSMRIDRLAESLGAKVFRAEVGEANVVNLAEELREKGFTVRILGEGSNGGNITHPSRVRDPLNTLTALMKLLVLRDDGDKPGLFRIWCERSGQMDLYRQDFNLDQIIDSLPPFVTTSAFEGDALMRIQATSHGLLKKRFEEIYLQEWEVKKEELARDWNLYSWRELNTEGTLEKEGIGPEFRSGEERGGLKILLMDEKSIPQAYLWMRGSGTEPVFRVMVDSSGSSSEREQFLLHWLRSMIEKADRQV